MAEKDTKKRTTTPSSKKSRNTDKSKKTSTKRNIEAKGAGKLSVKAIAVILMMASALLFVLSAFNIKGALLDLYAAFAKGLFGIGFYALPISLIAVSWIIIVTPDNHKKLSQQVAFFLIPLLVGAWGHLFSAWGTSYISRQVGKLYSDGKLLISGGIVAGLIADVLSYLLSEYGLLFVLLIGTIICAVYCFRMTLSELWEEAFKAIREKSEATEDAREVRREERRVIRQEERRLREEEQQNRAWIEEQEKRRLADEIRRNELAQKEATNPSDFDMPLGKERERPKGVFAFPEEDRQLPFEDQREPVFQDINVYEGIRINPETGEVIEDDLIESEVKTEDEISLQEKKKPIIAIPGTAVSGIEDIWDAMSDLQADIPTSEEMPEQVGMDNKVDSLQDTDVDIPNDVIHAYPDGNQDIILQEAGINREELEEDESKVSASLRPGEAEKRRMEENREKNKRPPYQKPSIELLKEDKTPPSPASEEEVKQNAKRLIETLQSFNIDARISNIIRGPSITRYEIQLKQGIRFSRLTALSDDIALALAAQAVRIAAIPDKVSIGIEVPNKIVNTVYIHDCICSIEFTQNPSKVAFALGKDITGKVIAWDIAKLPHMLVAGTTGSGKSVCINSLLVSLLYRADPEEVKFIMIDPKIIELGVYNGIPHLMTPVVTDPKKAAGALQWAVYEMMRRYKQMADLGVRSVFEYNAEVERRRLNPKEEGDGDRQKLPQIVIVIDELADLMLSSPREVEEAICRIAQMARAAGMHLIIATQRPSADVITGLMKANIPSRIAFAVSSAMESRIILDTPGAEKLIGKGDMLFSPIGAAKPIRIQGCFISSGEIEAVCSHAKAYGSPDYDQSVMEHIEKASQDIGKSRKAGTSQSEDDRDGGEADSPEDPMLYEAIDVVMESQMASASGLQRRLKLGYTRAARLIDMMEEKGIVGPFQGSKPREILMSKDRWMEMKASRGE